MECDLRIGRAIIDVSGRNGLRRTQLVDLDHPGGDMSPRRLPNEARRQSARKREATEKGEPRVLRCGSRRADTIVPDLRAKLVGRDRLRRLAIAAGGSAKPAGALSRIQLLSETSGPFRLPWVAPPSRVCPA